MSRPTMTLAEIARDASNEELPFVSQKELKWFFGDKIIIVGERGDKVGLCPTTQPSVARDAKGLYWSWGSLDILELSQCKSAVVAIPKATMVGMAPDEIIMEVEKTFPPAQSRNSILFEDHRDKYLVLPLVGRLKENEEELVNLAFTFAKDQFIYDFGKLDIENGGFERETTGSVARSILKRLTDDANGYFTSTRLFLAREDPRTGTCDNMLTTFLSNEAFNEKKNLPTLNRIIRALGRRKFGKLPSMKPVTVREANVVLELMEKARTLGQGSNVALFEEILGTIQFARLASTKKAAIAEIVRKTGGSSSRLFGENFEQSRWLRFTHHEELRTITSMLTKKTIDVDSLFVHDLSDVPICDEGEHPISLVDSAMAKSRLNAFVGGYLDELNLEKSFVLGSSIFCSLFRRGIEGKYGTLGEYFEVHYPYVFTRKIDAGHMQSISPELRDRVVSISDDMQSVTDDMQSACSSHKHFFVSRGVDVDIGVSAETQEEFDRIAREHYAVIRRHYPFVAFEKMILNEEYYSWQIVGKSVEDMRRFRPVEIYQMRFPFQWVGHHVPYVRGAYTSNLLGLPRFFVSSSLLVSMCELRRLEGKVADPDRPVEHFSDFRFFASVKQTPLDIVLKFQQRTGLKLYREFLGRFGVEEEYGVVCDNPFLSEKWCNMFVKDRYIE